MATSQQDLSIRIRVIYADEINVTQRCSQPLEGYATINRLVDAAAIVDT
jgi:hypothetical protein